MWGAGMLSRCQIKLEAGRFNFRHNFQADVQRGETMSRSNQALLIDELWDETQRLNEQVASLQDRLALYEEVEMPSQWSNSRLTTLQARASREDDANPWSVWPYSWAISARMITLSRLHSFHAKLHESGLAWRNRRERKGFWRRPHPEDISLKLM
jgi:hypothetical protein